MTGRILVPRDGGELRAALAAAGLPVEAVEGHYFRQDGDRRAIVGIRFLRQGQEGLGYIKVYGDPRRSREVVEKWERLKVRDGSFGTGLRPLPKDAGLLYLFPNDAGLRDLPLATDLDKLKRLIADAGLFPGVRVRGSRSRLKISRYKPEHRLVAFLDLEVKDDATGVSRPLALVMRLFADRRGASLTRLTRALREAGLADHLPRPHGDLLDGRLQIEERLAGTELLDGRTVEAEELGEILERFAATRVDGVPRVSPIEFVRTRIAAARAVLPRGLERLGLEIERRLSHLCPLEGTRGLIHGDLHPRQFIVDEGRIGLIDLERCGQSFPALDLGHFLTELELDAAERPAIADRADRLRTGLEARSMSRLGAADRRLLAIGRALGELAAIARIARRRGASQGAEEISAALERARTLLPDGRVAPSPSRLHPRRSAAWPAFATGTEDGNEIGGLYDPESGCFWGYDPRDDHDLPGLERALERGRLRGWRPGQRAVVELADGRGFLKILPPRRLEARLEVMRALHADPEADRLLPAVTGVDPATGTFELEAIAGESLHDRLAAGDESDLPAAGRALAGFHALGATPALERASDDDVDHFLDHALRFRPDLGRRLHDAHARLPAAQRHAGEGPIHGDMHDKNLIVTPRGVRIIDCESARSGPAARDLGNFIAHLELRTRQADPEGDDESVWRRRKAFIAGYESLRPLPSRGIEEERRRSLFRLACVYLFRRRWEGMALNLLEDLARGLLLLVVGLALGGCVTLVPEAEAITGAGADEAKERVSTGYIRRKDTVEIEGRFVDGGFIAERIEIEEDDDEIEIKSTLDSVSDDSLRVGSVDFRIEDGSIFLDADGGSMDPETLGARVGSWVKVEGIERDGLVHLRKISIRERRVDERARIQAPVRAVDRRARELQVGPIEVDYPRDVAVYWDVEGQAAPTAMERGLRPEEDPRLRKIVRIDDDDERRGGHALADWVSASGEVQWELEWRKNHNLRDDRKRDRLLHQASAKLELSFEIDDHLKAFTQFRAARDFELVDESDRLDFGFDASVEQAFVVALDFPFDGMALELGRQKFDHGREWVMDDDIDGLRLFWNLEHALLELSVSRQLLDPDADEDGVTNFLAAAHLEPFEDAELFIYGLHRRGGELVDLDRWHAGFSFEMEIEQFSFFLDVGYVTGKEDDLEVEGWGFDAMALYVFEEQDWEPSIYLGLAYGSGDDDRGDGKDSSFRQTGLEDNNDKLNGVTSFRYLGELLRPELSNLMVITAGFGFRPYRDSSVDLVFHHYRQVEPFPALRDTRLRLDPQGLVDQIGTEIDLVIGLEAWEPLEIEIVVGWFRPGQAFQHGADEAWFLTFQAEWNF